MSHYQKYIKYKSKYVNYKNNDIIGGGKKTEKINIKRALNENEINKMDIKFSEHLSEPWFRKVLNLSSLKLSTFR
jgi:hypothetical protein